MEDVEQGCSTPRNLEYQIPASQNCPPPPKKKTERRVKREPPKNGYFQSPELESFFGGSAQAQAQRRQVAWA